MRKVHPLLLLLALLTLKWSRQRKETTSFWTAVFCDVTKRTPASQTTAITFPAGCSVNLCDHPTAALYLSCSKCEVWKETKAKCFCRRSKQGEKNILVYGISVYFSVLTIKFLRAYIVTKIKIWKWMEHGASLIMEICYCWLKKIWQ